MDLGQPRLSILDVDGSDGTVEETFNCWGQKILIDVNQLCIQKQKLCDGQWRTCQSFVTDCKELIAMIKDPHVWPSFATELERMETLLICFPDFNIIHVPRARNQFSDFLAKTARSFYRKLHFIGCSIPIWLLSPLQA